MKVAERAKGNGLGDESTWNKNGELIEPNPATIAAAAAASAAAVTAESLARWNLQQKQEQEQGLRKLIVEMKEAVEGGDGDSDVNGHRPTLRRGGSSVGSGRSGRFSISGSGMFQDLETDPICLQSYLFNWLGGEKVTLQDR